MRSRSPKNSTPDGQVQREGTPNPDITVSFSLEMTSTKIHENLFTFLQQNYPLTLKLIKTLSFDIKPIF